MLKTIAPLALLFAAAIPAAYAQDSAPASVRVSFADLNLGTQAGVAALDRRIASAVNTVCPEAQSGRFDEELAVKNCRTAAARSIAAQRQVALATHTTILTVASGR